MRFDAACGVLPQRTVGLFNKTMILRYFVTDIGGRGVTRRGAARGVCAASPPQGQL
jgi:hypothetical protein